MEYEIQLRDLLAKVTKRLEAFSPADAHMLADVVLYGYCRDATDAAQATLLLAHSPFSRTSYLPARAAFEAGEDALLLVGEASTYDSNGALAYAIELVELQELQARWLLAGQDIGVSPPSQPFGTPEAVVDEEIRALNQAKPGSGDLLRAALAKARKPRRAKQHWSGLSRSAIAKLLPRYLDNDAAIASTADAFYGLLSVQSHPRLRAWAQPVSRTESGALLHRTDDVHAGLAVALAFTALKIANAALDGREQLEARIAGAA